MKARKARYKHDPSSYREYKNNSLRLRKSIIITAILNISRMINSRRESLRQMAAWLSDPFEADKVYLYSTIYKRGPVLLWELRRLEAIREDLRKYIPLL